MSILKSIQESQVRVEIFIPLSVAIFGIEELFKCHERIKAGGKPTALEAIAALALGSMSNEDADKLGSRPIGRTDSV